MSRARHLKESTDPLAALATLGEGLFEDSSWLAGCQVILAGDMPQECLGLLAHGRHMTATLNAHYGEPVALRVLAFRDEGAVYRRKILLTVGGGKRVVEFGVVRLDLSALPEKARQEVIERKTPLGEILARYDVLTQVEPRWYLRFSAPGAVVRYFDELRARNAFGRMATIHCNGQPALELLEVVPG